MFLWHNGSWIKGACLNIDPNDRGLTLGDGVFDTMRAENGHIHLGINHMERLCRHANAIDIHLPYHPSDLLKVAQDLLFKNNFKNGIQAIRTTVTRGAGARGLLPPETPNPTLFMKATPVSIPSDNTPVNLVISQKIRRNEHAPSAFIKSLNYLDNILAKQEAIDTGYDEALLLNTKGNISCATSSNIFFIKDDILHTPPISDGVMDGTLRNWVMSIRDVTQSSISLNDLSTFSSAFLTNSILGIQPVKRINTQHMSASSDIISELHTEWQKAQS